MGYPGYLAGGVEASASAGGQITPPIMGAAAFVMAEFLEVPYTTDRASLRSCRRRCTTSGSSASCTSSAKPSRSQGPAARGDPQAARRCCADGLADGGSARRADLRAVLRLLALHGGVLGHHHGARRWASSIRITASPLRDVFEGCRAGREATRSRSSAVCAAIGIVVGVVNTTGLGFRLGFLVTEQRARRWRRVSIPAVRVESRWASFTIAGSVALHLARC